MQGEGVAAVLVGYRVRRPDPGIPGSAATEKATRAPGPAPHGPDQRVVGVENGNPVRGQSFDQLTLGLGDSGLPAELAHVGVADVEHDADLGRCDLAEVRDVPDPAGAHLRDRNRVWRRSG